MFPVYYPEDLRQMDQECEAQSGLPSLLLMENAGTLLAKDAVALADGGPVWVLCGGGNNGGDGWVAARKLHQWGLPVQVLSLKDHGKPESDGGVMARAAVLDGVPWQNFKPLHSAERPPSLLIDALFGTGLSAEPEGLAAEALSWMAALAEKGTQILAADIPSGLCGKTGKVLASFPLPRATASISFGFLKSGLLMGEGPAHTGELIVADIGYPQTVQGSLAPRANLLEAADLIPVLPRRSPSGHKRTNGRVLVIGGSKRFPGAPQLAALGALYGGAGLVTLALPEGVFQMVAGRRLEFLPLSLPQTQEGTFSEAALPMLLETLTDQDAIVIGPGLSRHPETDSLVFALICEAPLPMVVDADAIGAISRKKDKLPRTFPASRLFTPHHGEWARLTEALFEESLEPSLENLTRFSEEWGGAWLIKQARTVVACQGDLTLNPSGNSNLSMAGTGDVLAGLAGTFLAKGLSEEIAGRLGAFVHGLAGEKLKEGEPAEELVKYLPVVMEELRVGVNSGKVKVVY